MYGLLQSGKIRLMFKYSFIAFIGVFLIILSVSAQSTQQVVFMFANGSNQINNVNFFVSFPKGIQPVNLSPKMIWEPVSRTLSVNIGIISPNQTLNITVEVSGKIGRHKISGQLNGDWMEIGRSFQSEPIAIETEIIDLTPPTAIEIAAKKIAAPIAVTLAVTGSSALITSAISANASFATNVAEVLRFIGFGFFRFRRRKPWGRVYNQFTKKPINGVAIKLLESKFQKLKDTQYTDKDGRFGFLIAPGAYYMTLSKRGFEELKTDLITIKAGEELNMEISLVSETSVVSHEKPLMAILKKILKFIDKINPWLLAGGTIISIIVAIIVPTIFNFIVIGVYAIMDAFKYLLAKKTLKSFGQVLDKNTKQPLELAVIRIFDSNKNWLLNSQVTDNSGKFKFLVTTGEYYITCAKNGYQPFTSQVLKIAGAGVVTWDIGLTPDT